jgi:hypothetical protein
MTFWQAYRALAWGILRGAVYAAFCFGSGLLMGYLLGDHPWLAALVGVATVAGALAVGARSMSHGRL